MTVAVRGTAASTRQIRVYLSPETISVSEPFPGIQMESLNDADLNSSIFSDKSVPATAI